MATEQISFTIPPKTRGFHLIDDDVMTALGSKLPKQGILHLFIQHSSAGLTINENADPSVRHDFEQSFNHLIKENEAFYTHTYEGADDMPAHIKSSLVGASLSIPISNGKLNLGTWQGIYLCEFRNQASARRLVATIFY